MGRRKTELVKEAKAYLIPRKSRVVKELELLAYHYLTMLDSVGNEQLSLTLKEKAT